MAAFYDQFIAFGVDNAGLERLLRLFQSFFLILTSYPTLIASALPTYPLSAHASTETALRQLQGRLNLTRRWMRLFRFLEAYQGGWRLYMSENKTLETWIDAHAKTCFGMFGMLESITLPDLLAVDNLEIFGFKSAIQINVDAQTFWFVALFLSALSSTIKLARLMSMKYAPEEEKDAAEEKTGAEKIEYMKRRKHEEKAWAKKVNAQVKTLALKVVSDSLDMIIPASTVGWIEVEPGVVGVAMFITSILTGWGVWRACASRLDQRV